MRAMQIVLVLMTAVLITGCPKRPTVQPASQAPASSSASTSQADNGGAQDGIPLSDRAALAELQKLGMIVYFDYDKSDIKPEFSSVIAAHAKFLNAGASRKVRLEGHTDERGSREYNIGLGERRTQAVRRALLLQGVREDQITTVSYGEERPAVAGHDEEAFAKNRRAEMAYGQ
jgi:peptidoglycan-associated lipoprotein